MQPSRIITSIAFFVLALACQKKDERLEQLGVTREEAEQILRNLEQRRSPPSPTATLARPRGPAMPPTRPAEPPVSAQSASGSEWLIDELVDLAPAAPSTAHANGVLLVDGENRLWLARLGKLSLGTKPVESPLRAIPDDVGRFPLGRGPSVAGAYAYWVTSHFLLRRPILPPHEPLEILAEDARVGTRASALVTRQALKEQTWVAYIALPSVKDGPLKAKLWHGTQQHLLLSPESSSALSVQLKSSKGDVVALALEARTGMTTIHARSVLAGEHRPELGADHVVWVGGSSQPMTELFVAPTPDGGFWGFLPTERDISHFGLAVLTLSHPQQGQIANVQWSNYANGLDPAPLDSAWVCGRQVVLFVQPETQERGSPQQLVLAELEDSRPIRPRPLSTSKAFYDVSIAPVRGGAVVSFVADYRTWGRTLRCGVNTESKRVKSPSSERKPTEPRP